MKEQPTLMDKIAFFDTTLRDGEQAPGYSMNNEEKLRMAMQLEALGVDVIEAGFAIASPGDFESVQSISRNIKKVTVASLSRALTKDIDAAWEAVKDAVHPRIHTFLATSDLHLEFKLRKTREQALEQVIEMVKYARNLCPEIEFSAEDASRTDIDYLCRVVEAAINSGATIINLPDTVGYATPEEFGAMIHAVCNRVPNIDKAVVSVHCHNDLGMAVANSLAGLRNGARQVEGAICGIGERAGNASLEEIAMAIRTRSDNYPYTYSLKTTEITRTARLLSQITGVKINPSKAIVGTNAFAHESGIHQHGMMANSRTYEIMTPESVGLLKNNLVLGKHSGIHAFAGRLESLGYTPDKETLDKLFAEFKKLCDRKKKVTDRDIIALVEAGHINKPKADDWMLENYVVNSGNTITSTACVTLKKDGKSYQEIAAGNGPVYASIRAVEKIIKHPFSLDDYQLQAVTENRDAQGEVLVKVSDDSGQYRGRGVSTDIIESSILSCLSAVNRMLDSEQNSIGPGPDAQEDQHFKHDMLMGHTDKDKEVTKN